MTNDGTPAIFRGKVCDFSDPYWRVEYQDNDWEEFTRRELVHAIRLANQPPIHTA